MLSSDLNDSDGEMGDCDVFDKNNNVQVSPKDLSSGDPGTEKNEQSQSGEEFPWLQSLT